MRLDPFQHPLVAAFIRRDTPPERFVVFFDDSPERQARESGLRTVPSDIVMRIVIRAVSRPHVQPEVCASGKRLRWRRPRHPARPAPRTPAACSKRQQRLAQLKQRGASALRLQRPVYIAAEQRKHVLRIPHRQNNRCETMLTSSGLAGNVLRRARQNAVNYSDAATRLRGCRWWLAYALRDLQDHLVLLIRPHQLGTVRKGFFAHSLFACVHKILFLRLPGFPANCAQLPVSPVQVAAALTAPWCRLPAQ